MTCPDCCSDTPTPGCKSCEQRQPTLFSVPPPPPADPRRLARAIEAERAKIRATYETRGRLAALHALDRTPIVALVGCSKSKYAEQAPARRLYGGPLFPAALAYAEAVADEIYILSAKHGLVHTEQVLTSYDYSMKDHNQKGRERWAIDIVEKLAVLYPRFRPTVICLAGEDYARPLFIPLLGKGWAFQTPLTSMMVGTRRAWLKEQIRTSAQFRRSPLPLPHELPPPPTEDAHGSSPG